MVMWSTILIVIPVTGIVSSSTSLNINILKIFLVRWDLHASDSAPGCTYYRRKNDPSQAEQEYWYAMEWRVDGVLASELLPKSFAVLQESCSFVKAIQEKPCHFKTRSSVSKDVTGLGKPFQSISTIIRHSLKGKEKRHSLSPVSRFASLSPTASTSSVEAYRMTNGTYIWSSDSSRDTSSTASSVDSNCSESSSTMKVPHALKGTINKEFKTLLAVAYKASDPSIGATPYDGANVLNQGPHCHHYFTPLAYKAHIQFELKHSGAAKQQEQLDRLLKELAKQEEELKVLEDELNTEV
ncbi:hypothetical protein M422DRAFT_53407 [Sphaerobolus stellatus SS14]|uniref:Uncharacterized protein n=1 Tax=Sphaerobolus stellatus (strain SS14) TaxID=990650 RepID=A0A0C9TN29_SPHS4|nr:hypothetical protein M422DRAFT_53407 [Sphaerobolus stellatus SS14]